jgi:hypothetical protein
MSDNVIVSIKDWNKIRRLVKESQELGALMASEIKEKDEIISGLQGIVEQLFKESQLNCSHS